MDEQPYRLILRRVGWVLVAIGLLDIGWMIYSVIHGMSYSSSLNIFAVIAGILLIRGGLKTAGLVRWIAVFFVSALVTLAALFPFLQPIGLTLVEICFGTGSVLVSVLFAIVIVALMYWVARELGREPIQVARQNTGLKRAGVRMPIVCGIGLVVVAFLILAVFLTGETADRAKREAAKEVGPGFSFHVTSLSVNESGRHKSVYAVVAGWSDKEVRDIRVHWEEEG